MAPKGSIRDPWHLAITCKFAPGNSILDPQSSMPTVESRRPRAKCHRPWAFSEIHKNLRKNMLFHGSALLGSMLRRAFLMIFRCWAPCGRRLGALWRLWGALCRLWGPLWRLWVATWRPKARSWTPDTSRGSATGGRVTRFWGPKALFREPEVDGRRPKAIGHGLSAKHTKT